MSTPAEKVLTHPTVGILGGGQLGQMMTLAGYPLGINTLCFDKTTDVPASLVGRVFAGELSQTDRLREWASQCDVLTYEFENFPAELVAHLAEIKPVAPGPRALAAAQDRWAEKRLFDELEIPITPFRVIRNESDLLTSFKELEAPAVLKTRTGGYDGKGQIVLNEGDELEPALKLISEAECIIEQWVPFDAEVSIIGVRSSDGEIAIYPLTRNEHRSGILHMSVAPAQVSDEISFHARRYMLSLLEALDYVGVLTLEMFAVGGRLLANEMAPRVHNSGHWTIEGALTSQFENHLRAVVGLPLGSTDLRAPSAMINLIGQIPDVTRVLEVSGASLHLYGKEPRPGRKLGHVTVTARDEKHLNSAMDELNEIVQNILS